MTGEQLGTVGFVGLGNMGWPMARHLRAGGVDLVLHDARAGRAATFAAEHGGRVAIDLAELAHASEVVITMLPNGNVVREVVLGAGARNLLEGLGPGTILVDMGSSDPRIYAEIEPALRRRAALLVDAPVSGAVSGAEAATLTIMAGGDGEVIDRVMPLFALVGQRVFRTGPLGSGQAMKALNNLGSAGCFLLTLEILLIGQRFGLDPQLMTEILNVSTGRNNATDKKIIPHVLSRRFDSGFALALMSKDLTTALGLAEATTTPTILGAPTLDAVRQALAALGGEADHTALARWLEDRVGTELRGAPGE
jgi:3-hydroxyisobutyrate dehydrogenase